MHHAVGVVSPITFAMHLAAASEHRYKLPNRPCVVIAGGREPIHWEAYPAHRFLYNGGGLPCCLMGGCWKSRCTLIGDNSEKDTRNVCENYVETDQKIKLLETGGEEISEENSRTIDLRIPKCMDMIKPRHVIEAIESYYEGGVLNYV